MFKFLTVLIHIINLLTIAYMIFKEKRSPNNIIAWTLILYIAPFIGFIVFLSSKIFAGIFFKKDLAFLNKKQFQAKDGKGK